MTSQNVETSKGGRNGHRYLTALVVSVLLLAHAALAIRSMAGKAVTTDEIQYLTAGYYHLRTGDFNFNATNPPLMKMLSAVPLLLLDPLLPPVHTDPKGWSSTEQWRYARAFLYENRVDADRMLFTARLPIVALSLVLGLYVFRWGCELYGQTAGCFALFFYALSPNILAHARLATLDLGLAAFMFIATYYFWRFMTQPSARSLVLCGIFAGLSLLTKTTAGFLAPIFGLYVVVCAVRRDGSGVFEKFPWVQRLHPSMVARRQLLCAGQAFCVIGLIVLAVLNVGYGFQGNLRSTPDTRVGEAKVENVQADAEAGLSLSALPHPLPSPFRHAIHLQSKLVASAGSVYLAGRIHEAGLWYLMAVSFLIKTPIPAILLFGGSMMYLLVQVKTLQAEWLLVSFICVIVFVFSYLGNINVGLRYILPIYPFIHVLISALVGRIFRRSKVAGAIAIVLAGWYLAASATIHPHYLAYFNESVGGPANGYRYLVDSNLDWGQDLKGLRDYMTERDVDRVGLAYFGSASADYYGIDYEYLPSVGLTPKTPQQKWWYEAGADDQVVDIPQSSFVAVSATMLGRPGWIRGKCYRIYEGLRRCEPVGQVGYSILIFETECLRPE